MSKYLILEFLFQFLLELFLIFLLKEYFLFQIFITIDIILSFFIYFSSISFYILELFNISIFIYSLIISEIDISILWIYFGLKNFLRYTFFSKYFKPEERERQSISQEVTYIDV